MLLNHSIQVLRSIVDSENNNKKGLENVAKKINNSYINVDAVNESLAVIEIKKLTENIQEFKNIIGTFKHELNKYKI